MNIRFIGQGYNTAYETSVASELINGLGDNGFNRFSCLVAFVSKAAVLGLKDAIETSKGHISNYHIVVGIDMKATSKEALEELISLGVTVYVYFTRQRIIFHPKVYLFEGDDKSLIIVGSNNLTQTGLIQNIEASLAIEIDAEDEDGNNLISDVKNYFNNIFNNNDQNLHLLDGELISRLHEAGIIPDESGRRASQEKNTITTASSETNDVMASILEDFPLIPIQPLPLGYRRPTRASSNIIERLPDYGDQETEQGIYDDTTVLNTIISQFGGIVWRHERVPGSSVQYGGAGTNPTGGLRLVQAKFHLGGATIDQTTYFRNNVFGQHSWHVESQNPYVETTTVGFRIIIKGRDFGVHNLTVRYKPTGEAGQGNYTTLVSWGDMGDPIRDENLRGSNLELHAPATGQISPFLMLFT